MAFSQDVSKIDDRIQTQNVEISKQSNDVSTKASGDSLEDPQAAVDYTGTAEKTDPEEIRLVRKLDIWMLPMLWLLNFLNVMLRQSISVAVLGGLNKDLGLKGTDFSTAVSIHYVGYILGQVPANMLLTRTPPSWTMPISVFLGSVVTLALVAVDDFKGLVLQRFFFGIIAAPCWPGTLYLATAFYKKKEVGTRVGILYSSNILSTAFQGLIAAPIFSELSGVRGLNGWKWFYVILGAITGFVSIISFFFFPNEPLSTWWLTPRERELAHNRMVADTVEKTADVSLFQGLKQAVKDKHVWVFAFSHHIHTASSSFRSFLPTLFDTLGYNTTITLVITAPPYLLATAVAILIGLSSGKRNERTWHLTALKLTAMVGFILGCATLNTAARLVAAFLFVGANYGVTSITLGWVGTTCAQTREKRAASLAMVNTAASISLIWSPYLWPDSSSPRYVLPLSASAAMCLVSVLCIWTLCFSLRIQNRRIKRQNEHASKFYAY